MTNEKRDKPSQDSEEGGDDDYTTVMLRNIPNKYTREMLVKELRVQGFTGKYDFLYIPTDFANDANPGYGFVNFRTNAARSLFEQKFNGQSVQDVLPVFKSSKVCEVTRAKHQGLQENVDRLRTSAELMSRLAVRQDCTPLMFDENGNLINFDTPQPCGEVDKNSENKYPPNSSRQRKGRNAGSVSNDKNGRGSAAAPAATATAAAGGRSQARSRKKSVSTGKNSAQKKQSTTSSSFSLANSIADIDSIKAFIPGALTVTTAASNNNTTTTTTTTKQNGGKKHKNNKGNSRSVSSPTGPLGSSSEEGEETLVSSSSRSRHHHVKSPAPGLSAAHALRGMDNFVSLEDTVAVNSSNCNNYFSPYGDNYSALSAHLKGEDLSAQRTVSHTEYDYQDAAVPQGIYCDPYALPMSQKASAAAAASLSLLFREKMWADRCWAETTTTTASANGKSGQGRTQNGKRTKSGSNKSGSNGGLNGGHGAGGQQQKSKLLSHTVSVYPNESVAREQERREQERIRIEEKIRAFTQPLKSRKPDTNISGATPADDVLSPPPGIVQEEVEVKEVKEVQKEKTVVKEEVVVVHKASERVRGDKDGAAKRKALVSKSSKQRKTTTPPPSLSEMLAEESGGTFASKEEEINTAYLRACQEWMNANGSPYVYQLDPMLQSEATGTPWGWNTYSEESWETSWPEF